MGKITAYSELHQQGRISFEDLSPVSDAIGFELPVTSGYMDGDIGIQIASDGRIWVCIDGRPLLRFKPGVIKCEIP